MNGRRLLAIVALFGAATGFFVFLASARAPETWLFFRLALYALACLVFYLIEKYFHKTWISMP
jgi:hypothetical protein